MRHLFFLGILIVLLFLFITYDKDISDRSEMILKIEDRTFSDGIRKEVLQHNDINTTSEIPTYKIVILVFILLAAIIVFIMILLV